MTSLGAKGLTGPRKKSRLVGELPSDRFVARLIKDGEGSRPRRLPRTHHLSYAAWQTMLTEAVLQLHTERGRTRSKISPGLDAAIASIQASRDGKVGMSYVEEVMRRMRQSSQASAPSTAASNPSSRDVDREMDEYLIHVQAAIEMYGGDRDVRRRFRRRRRRDAGQQREEPPEEGDGADRRQRRLVHEGQGRGRPEGAGVDDARRHRVRQEAAAHRHRHRQD
jgi:hypothetical protein